MKRLHRILNLKPMRHQPLHIHNPTLHQPYGPRPHIRIAILELQINLLRAEAHEWQADLALAHPNHKHLTPKLDRPDCACDAALHARTLERDRQRHAACRVFDVFARLLGGDTALDLVGAGGGDKLLRKAEAAFIDIGDDDRLCTGGSAAEEGDKTNWAGTANKYWVAKADTTAIDTSKGDTEWLEQGAFFEAHVAYLMAPQGRMVQVAAEKTMEGRCGEELDVQAAIVAASKAGFAGMAYYVRLNGDAVAGLEMRDGGVHGDDNSCGLMAKDVSVFYNHGPNPSGMPEMDIRPVN